MQFTTQAVIDRVRGEDPLRARRHLHRQRPVPRRHASHGREVREAVLLPRARCCAGSPNTGHWPDIGGSVPGGFSARATEVEQEGLRLPPVKLFKARRARRRDPRRSSSPTSASPTSASATSRRRRPRSRRREAAHRAARPLRRRRRSTRAIVELQARAARQMRAKIARSPTASTKARPSSTPTASSTSRCASRLTHHEGGRGRSPSTCRGRRRRAAAR